MVGIGPALEHAKTIVPALFLTPASPSIMCEPPKEAKLSRLAVSATAVLVRYG